MDASTRLNRAAQLRQAGRVGEAADLAKPLARQFPADLQVQMTVGMIARDAGRFDLALACFDRALSLQPADPQIANIRANALAAAGRGEEALGAFDALLAGRSDFFDGHLNRAITAHEIRSPRALALVEASLAAFPGNGRLLSLKGEILRSAEQWVEAIDVHQTAVAADPQRRLHHMRLGVALRAASRDAEALESYARVRALGGSGATLDSLEAAALLEVDRVDEAEALYRRAFAGGDAEAGHALQRLRREYRGDAEADSHFGEAARAAGSPEAWLAWLRALSSFGEFDRLREAGAEALAAHPRDPWIAFLYQSARGASGERAAAYAELGKLRGRLGNDAGLDLELARLALMLGEPARAEKHVQAVLAQYPHDQAALAYLATIWRVTADPREEWLCNYERMVVPVDVPGPDGMRSSDYAREVAAVLDTLHATRAAPGDQSLRSGTQTSGNLFARSNPAIAQFRGCLHAAVARIVADFPDDPDHPFWGRRGSDIGFSGSWSVKLRGGGGYHVPHFHSAGWISSAYYARLPETLGGESGDAGWIAFGEPPEDLGLALGPRRVVEPREGRLVLFPSYMWHGTVPFEGVSARLTAAFDVVPRG